MIETMSTSNLQLCLDFAWELSQNLTTSCYPIKKTKEDLKKAFLRRLAGTYDQVLMYFKDDKLIGVIEIYIDTKEEYVQLGSYIKEDLPTIMEEIIQYLQQRYSHYTVHFTYPKENVVAIDYLKHKGCLCIEESNDLRLDIREFRFECDNDISFERLKKEDFTSYAAFHDRHGGTEIYWNSKRIYEMFDKWYIYVYKQGTNIVASSLTCKSGEEAIEIFGLSVDDIESSAYIAKELLGQTIKSILEIETQTKQVIYFVENENVSEYTSALQLGFKEMGGFCCYSYVLI